MSDSVDWAGWVDEQRKVSSADCARLRRRLAGSSERLSELAERDFGEFTRTQLSRHANGRCSHTHGVAPVECVQRWVPRDEA